MYIIFIYSHNEPGRIIPKMVRVSAIGSKHMGLWRGHVGHVWLLWLLLIMFVFTPHLRILGGVHIGVKSMGSAADP